MTKNTGTVNPNPLLTQGVTLVAGSVAVTSPTSEQLVQIDDWLTAVCGRRVVRVGSCLDALKAEAAAHSVRSALESSEAAFAFAKIDTRHVAAAGVLQEAGLRVVDVSITLSTPPIVHTANSSDSIEVVLLPAMPDNAADAHDLTRIAGECFRYSRFHLDPKFPDADADQIKRQWVANYLRGQRGDRIWGARVDGCWAGFLAAIKTKQGDAAAIDLIGVDSRFQGQGVGGRLIDAFQRHYESQVKTLRVGTQAANAPSIRLYQKMGFRFEQSAFVLHWCVKQQAEIIA